MKVQSLWLGGLMAVFFVWFLAIGAIALEKSNASASQESKTEIKQASKLPKMIDLGSKNCIPCKRMAPILDSLRQEYEGRAEIIFIDTRENRQAAAQYKINFIPTQIFFDTLGVERYRHIGFYPADSIVAHLRALGVK